MTAVFRFTVDDQLSPGLDAMGSGLAALEVSAEEVSRSQHRLAAAIGVTAVGIAKHRLVMNSAREAITLYQRTAADTTGLTGLARASRTAELAVQGTGRAVASTARDLIQLPRLQVPVVKALDSIRQGFLGTETAAGRATLAAERYLLKQERFGLLRRGAALASSIPGVEAAAGAAGTLGRAGLGVARLASSTALAGAALGVQGLRAVQARTGVRNLGTREDFSESTDAQIEAFNKLADVSQATGRAIEDVLAEAGQSWDDFGVRIVRVTETNLDRVDAAFARVGGRITRTFRESAAAADELFARPVRETVGAAWDSIDRKITENTDQMVTNIDLIGEALQGAIDTVRATGFETGAQARQAAQDLRELADHHVRLDQLREEERGHFERLRVVQAQLAQGAADRAEAERIASISTREGIAAEMQLAREQVGQRLIGTEQFLQRMQVYEQRLTQIVAAETRHREELQQDAAERQQQFLQDQEDEYYRVGNARAAASRAAYDAEVETLARLAELEHEHAAAARQRVLDQLAERVEQEGGSLEDVAAIRRAQLDQRLADELAVATDAVEIRRAQLEHAAALDELAAQERREQRQRELSEQQAAARGALEIEQDKQDRIRGLLAEQGITAQSVRDRVDPRAVQRQFAQSRAAEAAAEFARAHQSQFELDDPQQRRQFQRRQKEEAQQAFRAANRQFGRGQVDPAELQQAQRQATDELLTTLGQSGQVDQQTLAVLREQQAALSAQQSLLDQQGQALSQIMAKAKELTGAAHESRQRQRAQGGGRL